MSQVRNWRIFSVPCPRWRWTEDTWDDHQIWAHPCDQDSWPGGKYFLCLLVYVYLMFLFLIIEERPVMESLNLAILLLSHEHVFKPWWTLYSLTSAVDIKPKLGQQLLEFWFWLSEQTLGLEKHQGRLHSVGLHDLSQKVLFFSSLKACSVFTNFDILLIIVVQVSQSLVHWPPPDILAHTLDQRSCWTISCSTLPSPAASVKIKINSVSIIS